MINDHKNSQSKLIERKEWKTERKRNEKENKKKKKGKREKCKYMPERFLR